MKKLIILLLTASCVASCVSTNKFNSMKAEALKLEGQLEDANSRVESLNQRNARLNEEKNRLVADTVRLFNNYTYLQKQLREMSDRYRQLAADGSAEASRMLKELERNQQSLDERSRKVAELEALLKSREEAMESIRRKVADALTGFEGKGLSITARNGNVYVSMDDKLLFRSGSFDIDPNGARAVRDLASVLAQNPDINIMVEGHTDDVPYRPNGNLQDNLDLSVKRATTVTRLLLENKNIDPARIISAGRGEFLPVDPAKSTEARARNRRTEIILTPKINELIQLVESSSN